MRSMATSTFDLATREALLHNRTLELTTLRLAERAWLDGRYASLRLREEALANKTLAMLDKLEALFPAVDDNNNNPTRVSNGGGGVRAQQRAAKGAGVKPGALKLLSPRAAAAVAAARQHAQLAPSAALSAADLVDAASRASKTPQCPINAATAILPLVDVAKSIGLQLHSKLGEQAMSKVTLFGASSSAMLSNESSSQQQPMVHLLELQPNSNFCSQKTNALDLPISLQQGSYRIALVVGASSSTAASGPSAPSQQQPWWRVIKEAMIPGGPLAAAAALHGGGESGTNTPRVLMQLSNAESPKGMLHSNRLLLFYNVHRPLQSSSALVELRQWTWPSLLPLSKPIAFRWASSASAPRAPGRGASPTVSQWVPLVVTHRHVLFSTSLEPHVVIRCPLPAVDQPAAAPFEEEQMVGDGGAASSRLTSNCTLRSRTTSPNLWSTAFSLPSSSSGRLEPIPYSRSPPTGGTPCVRIKGLRVCLGRAEVLPKGAYKSTSYHFWYAVSPQQSYSITNVSLLFRFKSLGSKQSASAVQRMGSSFAPRNRRAFDTEKLQKATGLVRVNESMLLVSYGLSGCVCAQRYVCVEDVLRMLERRLVVSSL